MVEKKKNIKRRKIFCYTWKLHEYFLSDIFSLFPGLFPSINTLYLKKKKKLEYLLS